MHNLVSGKLLWSCINGQQEEKMAIYICTLLKQKGFVYSITIHKGNK